ncbi:MotA/TolQ/ExbB proton channel family protein [Uliginosibacterium sediminicola]
MHVLDILHAAGWPIYFLLLASIISLALIIERAISLRRNQIVPPGFLEKLVAELRQNGVSDELIKRVHAHSPLGQVLAAGLRNMRSTREVMKESIEEAGRAVAHDLERFLTTLGTIATVSPLMGLFGTVIGMIELFGAQNPAGGGTDPQQLAHGISVALYNTGFGLMIAIPSLIAHRHYRALVDSLIVDMEQQAVRMVEAVHGERRK